MATSVTKGGTQKLPKQFKIVETYPQDHSLESFIQIHVITVKLLREILNLSGQWSVTRVYFNGRLSFVLIKSKMSCDCSEEKFSFFCSQTSG
jgi:hypothetical protein